MPRFNPKEVRCVRAVAEALGLSSDDVRGYSYALEGDPDNYALKLAEDQAMLIQFWDPDELKALPSHPSVPVFSPGPEADLGALAADQLGHVRKVAEALGADLGAVVVAGAGGAMPTFTVPVESAVLEVWFDPDVLDGFEHEAAVL